MAYRPICGVERVTSRDSGAKLVILNIELHVCNHVYRRRCLFSFVLGQENQWNWCKWILSEWFKRCRQWKWKWVRSCARAWFMKWTGGFQQTKMPYTESFFYGLYRWLDVSVGDKKMVLASKEITVGENSVRLQCPWMRDQWWFDRGWKTTTERETAANRLIAIKSTNSC